MLGAATVALGVLWMVTVKDRAMATAQNTEQLGLSAALWQVL
jgi:hypothetical protein